MEVLFRRSIGPSTTSTYGIIIDRFRRRTCWLDEGYRSTTTAQWVGGTASRTTTSMSTRQHSTKTVPSKSLIDYDLSSPDCNVTESIVAKVGKNLHQRPNHPLYLIHQKIVQYYNQTHHNTSNKGNNDSTYQVFNDISPIVTTQQNFDWLRIPPDHVSRSMSDTYYLNQGTVLRCHTSAHQVELLAQGVNRFLVSGDVYRRDEIDRSHYPVFHQLEGVKIMEHDTTISDIVHDLKQSLEGLAVFLFGPVKMRWVQEHFPFTHPSYELEIFFQNEWMEVLGCGVIHPDILVNAGRSHDQGWAFGLGLERLAMILFQIPDIRLFWSDDERFHKQFATGHSNIVFQPYSKYPPCSKDVSFWIPKNFHVNDLNEVVRDVAGDLVEQVEFIDAFTHPSTSRTSHCYRIVYRSMDRSLVNKEIDALQEELRTELVQRMNVELR